MFIIAVFLAALRGKKVFKFNLSETRKFFLESMGNVKQPHIVLPLRGKYKGGTRENFHFVSVTCKSDSEECG